MRGRSQEKTAAPAGHAFVVRLEVTIDLQGAHDGAHQPAARACGSFAVAAGRLAGCAALPGSPRGTRAGGGRRAAGGCGSGGWAGGRGKGTFAPACLRAGHRLIINCLETDARYGDREPAPPRAEPRRSLTDPVCAVAALGGRACGARGGEVHGPRRARARQGPTEGPRYRLEVCRAGVAVSLVLVRRWISVCWRRARRESERHQNPDGTGRGTFAHKRAEKS